MIDCRNSRKLFIEVKTNSNRIWIAFFSEISKLVWINTKNLLFIILINIKVLLLNIGTIIFFLNPHVLLTMLGQVYTTKSHRKPNRITPYNNFCKWKNPKISFLYYRRTIWNTLKKIHLPLKNLIYRGRKTNICNNIQWHTQQVEEYSKIIVSKIMDLMKQIWNYSYVLDNETLNSIIFFVFFCCFFFNISFKDVT